MSCKLCCLHFDQITKKKDEMDEMLKLVENNCFLYVVFYRYFTGIVKDDPNVQRHLFVLLTSDLCLSLTEKFHNGTTTSVMTLQTVCDLPF